MLEHKFLLNHADGLRKLIDRENVVEFLKSQKISEEDISRIKEIMDKLLKVLGNENIEKIEFDEIEFGT